jgi:putative SOS response-associated peptidase YedK
VKLLGADVEPSARQIHLPRFNMGPVQGVISVGGGGPGVVGTPTFIGAVWGLQLGGRVVTNLRSETAGRRSSLLSCVVLADGFRSWTGERKHRRPI